ncbi:uncharacterized protein MELLADRAFT_101711 [Melampsora larici-populina 98AG31]|uniref:Uncharacterized protein n=1 Tax=Melampsora larici-populina (strain 98AG31 / pathotype 3-4-7) TaxID=747676 RepID=F4R6Q4_MELLP|nr:uncharacterized protein MELLADRAFT_101711 [Melampsora larici-populina 98AG31]EGG12421.1 hypothetical protein MELLADRAFT_101711 [Melampsora larici-populina 98AG31]
MSTSSLGATPSDGRVTQGAHRVTQVYRGNRENSVPPESQEGSHLPPEAPPPAEKVPAAKKTRKEPKTKDTNLGTQTQNQPPEQVSEPENLENQGQAHSSDDQNPTQLLLQQEQERPQNLIKLKCKPKRKAQDRSLKNKQ